MEDFWTLRRVALITLLIVLFIGSAQSWDNYKVHPKINELAFDRFVKEWMPKDDKLKQASIQNTESWGEAWDLDMGTDLGLHSVNPNTAILDLFDIQYMSKERKKIIKDWLISGGFSADEPEAPQALRHFYDPERDPHYLTDTVNDLPFTTSANPTTSALDWAFSDPSNPYSFPKAKQYFKDAAASLPDAPGNIMYGKAWRAVGETMHLISDMTVPAHVRNDCHIPFTESLRDPFEYYTTVEDVEDYGDGYYPPSNSINYHRTYLEHGDLRSLMHDVAKWTNNNFLSRDTVPIEGKETTPNGKKAYALPAIDWSSVKAGDLYYGKVDGQVIPLAKASSTGVFWKSTELVIDGRVSAAYLKLLIPTAIEASAAVLDAFLPRFDVKIDSIEKDPSDSSQYIVKGNLNLIKTNVWSDPSELIVRNGATLKDVNKKTGKENDWPLDCPSDGNLNSIIWKGQLESNGDEVTLEYNLGGYVVTSKPYTMANNTIKNDFACDPIDYSKLKKFDMENNLYEVYYEDSNGKRQGEYWRYYDKYKNQPEAASCYLNDEIHGHFICWYNNGKKEQEGYKENGNFVGHFTSWFENGNKEEEGDYKDGLENGHWTSWYDNGNKKCEGDYSDDSKTGQWTYWSEDGSIDHTENYPIFS